MIALVRLLPAAGASAGIELLDELPAPGDCVHTAYLVRCRDRAELDAALSWYGEVRSTQGGVGLGLVCPPDVCAAALGRTTDPVRPVLSPTALEGDRLPPEALDELRAGSLEGRLLDELVATYGDVILGRRELLEAVVSHAIRGGTLRRAAASVRLEPVTLRRRLQAVGLSPGSLKGHIRLRAYELLVELGHDPSAALRACGWNDQDALDNFRRRHGDGQAPLDVGK